jgi:hypothetical protein
MKTLSVPIQNSMDVPRIAKFEVTDVVDNDNQVPPNLGISVRTYGPGNVPYMGNLYLTAYDDQASTCAKPNPLQQSYGDMLMVFGQVVAGAYTTLSTAYNANIANPTKRKRCLAVEALLVGTLLSADFAAT